MFSLYMNIFLNVLILGSSNGFNFTCKEDEERGIAPFCQPTCLNLLVSSIYCHLVWNDSCLCKAGQVWNKNNECINPEDCPNTLQKRNDCKLNQIWRGGSTCPEDNCYDILASPFKNASSVEPVLKTCEDVIVNKCFCEPGFVKNLTGFCILRDDCFAFTCERNEEQRFDMRCQLACRKPEVSLTNCSLGSTTMCYCKPGFVWDVHYECVRPTDCPEFISNPVECESDKIWQEGSSCPITCSDVRIYGTNSSDPYALVGRPCPDERKLLGCFCKPGLVLNKTGACVTSHDCFAFPTGPEDCGLGELWGEGSSCPKTCKDIREVLRDLHDPPQNPVLKPCDEQKKYGCFCRWNLLRNSSGSCVRREDCPYTKANCKSDEVWRDDSTSCPQTCESDERDANKWIPYLLKCNVDKFEYCFCKPHFFRDLDGDGACVAGFTRCTRLVCKKNEVLAHGINCPITCATLNVTLPQDCYMHRGRKCHCREGFIKNDAGTCVKPEDCPQ